LAPNDYKKSIKTHVHSALLLAEKRKQANPMKRESEDKKIP